MTDARIVLSTAGSREEAERIATALMERRLAACVNMVPQLRSIYRWEGKVEQAEEVLLIIKTSADRFPSVRDAVESLHSYDVPECVCLTVEDGSEKYLKWIAEMVKK